MTLRLVDKDNVVPLVTAWTRDILSGAQGFAAAVEDGSLALRQALIVTVDENGMVDFAAIGEQPTIAEAIGTIELCKLKIGMGAFRS
jgi:hypothetical protein